MNLDELKFPIGKFEMPQKISGEQLSIWIGQIESFPKNIETLVGNLDENQLEKKYRPDGWTIRQIINHCADSHMNSFIRFKLALTEERPTIKPYREDLWAALADSKEIPVRHSMRILEGLHARWAFLLKSLSEKDLEKSFMHPETAEEIALKTNIGIYAWHCEHHLAHIKTALNN